jgi:hypothetical protein
MPLYNPTTISGNITVGDVSCSSVSCEGSVLTESITANDAIGVGGVASLSSYASFAQIADTGAPTSNTINVFAMDNGGSSTLALRCEQAVAVDVVAASTHTLTVKINNVSYKILLST